MNFRESINLDEGIAEPFDLPVTLKTTAGFEVFLQALEDRTVRAGLVKREQTLPRGVNQIIAMIDDGQFMEMALRTSQQLVSMQKGRAAVKDVKAMGRELNDYVTTKYPEATRLLTDYASKAFPRLPVSDIGIGGGDGGGIGFNFDVAANAEAVVNAAVWANVAIATSAVLAAAAVVFIAVFVL